MVGERALSDVNGKATFRAVPFKRNFCAAPFIVYTNYPQSPALINMYLLYLLMCTSAPCQKAPFWMFMCGRINALA